jgi:hypothetical protein
MVKLAEIHDLSEHYSLSLSLHHFVLTLFVFHCHHEYVECTDQSVTLQMGDGHLQL